MLSVDSISVCYPFCFITAIRFSVVGQTTNVCTYAGDVFVHTHTHSRLPSQATKTSIVGVHSTIKPFICLAACLTACLLTFWYAHTYIHIQMHKTKAHLRYTTTKYIFSIFLWISFATATTVVYHKVRIGAQWKFARVNKRAIEIVCTRARTLIQPQSVSRSYVCTVCLIPLSVKSISWYKSLELEWREYEWCESVHMLCVLLLLFNWSAYVQLPIFFFETP